MEKRIKLFAVCISCLIATSLLTWNINTHFFDQREQELRYYFELEQNKWENHKRIQEETISQLESKINLMENELLENQKLVKKIKKYLKSENKILEKMDKHKKIANSLIKEINEQKKFAK